jgi:hypothetical protein
MPGTSPVHRTFPGTAASVRGAREFVRDVVAAEPRVDVDLAVLLAGELAANAVVHAASDYTVSVRRSSETVRVEVQNDEPEVFAGLVAAGVESGRGLQMLESAASRWGTFSDPEHKVVWFELDVNGMHST